MAPPKQAPADDTTDADDIDTTGSENSSNFSTDTENPGYPTGQSPIMPGSLKLEPRWVEASSYSFIFDLKMPPPEQVEQRRTVCRRKYEHMQRYFWPELDRHNCMGRDRERENTWQYLDMQGMIDWYRKCFHIPIWERGGSRADGMWLNVLNTSPWFDCPLFDDIKSVPRVGEDGEPMRDDRGHVIRTLRDPRGNPDAEAEFMQIWLEATQYKIRRFDDGRLVLPWNKYEFTVGKGGRDPHTWREKYTGSSDAEES